MAISLAIHGLLLIGLRPDAALRVSGRMPGGVEVELLPETGGNPSPGPTAMSSRLAARPEASSPNATGIRHRSRQPRSALVARAARVANRQGTSRPEQPVRAAAPSRIATARTSRSPSPSGRTTGDEARSLVRRHLEAFKYYPASARRRGIGGNVDVAFSLNRHGMAEGVEILRGSGHAVLDRAAVRTVARAQPFPVDHGRFRFRLHFGRL